MKKTILVKKKTEKKQLKKKVKKQAKYKKPATETKEEVVEVKSDDDQKAEAMVVGR